MIKPNSIIKWISVSGLLMAQTTFAGLCADLSSPTRYDLLNVKEFIWDETNVHDLVTPDENRSLDSAQQVQIIEASLSYKIPYQLTLNCQWTRSSTLVLNNFGSDKFSSDDTTQYFKVRDANEEDVENTGNVGIGSGINYWLHQVD
mgnify:FL=1